MERLDRMRERFAKKWAVSPTYAVLVKRSLKVAEEGAVEAPPERERLDVAWLQFRRLSAEAVSARGRERLFPVWGELVGLLQRTNQLRHSIASRRKEWKDWGQAQAEAGDLMAQIGKLQDQIAVTMKTGRG